MENVTINQEQRLFVIRSSAGYTCLGFDVCYQWACQMAKLMSVVRPAKVEANSLAPSPALIGTMDGYKQYLSLLDRFAKHPANKNTWFDPATLPIVKALINKALNDFQDGNAEIYRFFHGDPATGRDWGEEWDTIGFVGRTGGTYKSPLLLEPLWDSFKNLVKASGGGILSTNRIIRVINVTRNEEVYRAKNYQMPELLLGSGPSTDLPFSVSRDGKVQANFKSWEDASEYVAFIQGHRVARPYRTVKEYQAELREAA